jgi:hypothetical protein
MMTRALKALRILAVVAAIVAVVIYAFARMTGMREKSAWMKGGLSTVRSAIQVYYGDTEGWFPADDLSCLMKDGKYLARLPELWNEKRVKYPHPRSSGVETYRGGELLRDTGKWAYFNDPADKAGWGNFVIDCTHVQMIGGGLFERQRPGEVWSTF